MNHLERLWFASFIRVIEHLEDNLMESIAPDPQPVEMGGGGEGSRSRNQSKEGFGGDALLFPIILTWSYAGNGVKKRLSCYKMQIVDGTLGTDNVHKTNFVTHCFV